MRVRWPGCSTSGSGVVLSGLLVAVHPRWGMNGHMCVVGGSARGAGVSAEVRRGVLDAITPSAVVAFECMAPARTDLFPAEVEYLRRAVPRRQREFEAARACAGAALAEVGVDRPALVPGVSGAPSWPAGVVGTMTHCQGFYGAAVARADVVASVGVDAEPNEPLPDGVLPFVAGEVERGKMQRLGLRRPGVCWDRLLFSAKESLFKAWFPLTGSRLEFLESEIHFYADLRVFEAAVGAGVDVPEILRGRLLGRWHVSDDLIRTALVVPTGL